MKLLILKEKCLLEIGYFISFGAINVIVQFMEKVLIL